MLDYDTAGDGIRLYIPDPGSTKELPLERVKESILATTARNANPHPRRGAVRDECQIESLHLNFHALPANVPEALLGCIVPRGRRARIRRPQRFCDTKPAGLSGQTDRRGRRDAAPATPPSLLPSLRAFSVHRLHLRKKSPCNRALLNMRYAAACGCGSAPAEVTVPSLGSWSSF
jgi:hypothetical protein